MRLLDNKLTFSATDLTSHFECAHKTVLDLKVAQKALERPRASEIERRMLELRGRTHELEVRASLEAKGLRVVDIGSLPLTEHSAVTQAAATLLAMREGVDVIYQGVLQNENWGGRPDFLIRKDGVSSQLGNYYYEPADAKLARAEKARAVLQLCVYADLLQATQGILPEQLWLALGADAGRLDPLWTRDYFAYYSEAKRGLSAFVGSEGAEPYPEPCEFCDVCEWWRHCEKRRQKDDHLSLVAGITKRQRIKLTAAGVQQLVTLAQLSKSQSVEGIEASSLAKIRHQAELQHQGRTEGVPVHQLLEDADPGAGLELLPEPRPGDLFLDLEGEAFVRDGGLEYLFGLLELGKPSEDFVSRALPGAPNYLSFWATTREEEKTAFEAVMDRITDGLAEFQDMHVFHFGHRENDALKKLSCRHATREAEVDHLLRKGVLIDLHRVVQQSLRASVESYSLKELEVFHGFQREVDKRAAARAMQYFGWWLETRDPELDVAELRNTLGRYNQEDCISTWKLRDWLEGQRVVLAQKLGRKLTRPTPGESEPNEDEMKETLVVAKQLLSGLPEDPTLDSPEQKAPRLLAHLLDWHRREEKPVYWEYFNARDTTRSEWMGSHLVLAGLEYVGIDRTEKQSHIHRYKFLPQDHAVKKTPTPEIAGTDKKTVKVVSVGSDFILVSRGTKRVDELHPVALRPGRPFDAEEQKAQILSVGKEVAANGFPQGGLFGLAGELLLRRPPRCGQELGQALVRDGEDTVEAVKRLCLSLKGSVLAIQGPPGSGKSFRAAHAIVALVRAGKRVGVTANSHQVILSLLKKAAEIAAEEGVSVHAHHLGEPDEWDEESMPFPVAKDYSGVEAKLKQGTLNVVGGTAFAWSRQQFEGALDYLFVDEAGQMSLANTLAVSKSAKNMVLLGDPAQLEQPQKGTHPPSADVSALEHVLGGARTMPPDIGVFLPETRRLHPGICGFTSAVFYEGRLDAMPGLEKQRINGPAPFDGAGLRLIAVEHEGNTNRSDEEVGIIASRVAQLFESGATFTDQNGQTRALRIGQREKDVLIVAPYNAQVGALKQALPLDRVAVGTVDKFQGQEAPVVIYSMTTSSGDEAPRGLEFLFSLNRLNVATSRAQALVILVASTELTKAKCRTPRHLKLVNGLCEYRGRVG